MPRGGGHFRGQNPNKDLLESMWHLAVKNAMYAYPLSTFMTQLAKERNAGTNMASQRRALVDHMRAKEQCVMKEFDKQFDDLLSNMELLITECTRDSTLDQLYY